MVWVDAHVLVFVLLGFFPLFSQSIVVLNELDYLFRFDSNFKVKVLSLISFCFLFDFRQFSIKLMGLSYSEIIPERYDKTIRDII